MKTFNYILFLICVVIVGVAFADGTIYVRANANLAEIIPDPPLVVNATIKQKLNAGAIDDCGVGVQCLTVQKAKAILGVTSSEAERVIDELIEDGVIKTYQERYEELYPSNADLP